MRIIMYEFGEFSVIRFPITPVASSFSCLSPLYVPNAAVQSKSSTDTAFPLRQTSSIRCRLCLNFRYSMLFAIDLPPFSPYCGPPWHLIRYLSVSTPATGLAEHLQAEKLAFVPSELRLGCSADGPVRGSMACRLTESAMALNRNQWVHFRARRSAAYIFDRFPT